MAVEAYLNYNKEILDSLRDSRNLSQKDSLGRTNANRVRELATARDICAWLGGESVIKLFSLLNAFLSHLRLELISIN